MPHISLAPHLLRHLSDRPELKQGLSVQGNSVRSALEDAFRQVPRLRGYVLDEQGQARRHVAIFVNGAQVADRKELGDKVGDADRIHLLQALTGG